MKQANSDRILIKKYENRRLYDTSASKYVNLEDVAALVREGRDVQVVDAKSGDDLTRSILTQIIMDDAREPKSAMPLDFLRQMIAASDKARNDFFGWYAKMAQDGLTRAQEAMRAGFPPGMPGMPVIPIQMPLPGFPPPPAVNPMEAMQAWMKANAAAFGMAWPGAGAAIPEPVPSAPAQEAPPAPAAPPPAEPAEAPPGDPLAELAELRRRMEQLESSIRDGGSAGKPGKKKS